MIHDINFNHKLMIKYYLYNLNEYRFISEILLKVRLASNNPLTIIKG